VNQNLLPVNNLIEAVRAELFRVKYKAQRINLYESIWAALVRYMEKRDSRHFDMKVGPYLSV